MYMKGTVLQNQSQALLTAVTRDLLRDEEMESKLIPKFSVGCKRIIPSGYSYLKVSPEASITSQLPKLADN